MRSFLGTHGIGPSVSPLLLPLPFGNGLFAGSIPSFAFGMWENTALGLCCVPGLLPRVPRTLGQLGRNLFAWRFSEASLYHGLSACRPAIMLQAAWGKNRQSHENRAHVNFSHAFGFRLVLSWKRQRP